MLKRAGSIEMVIFIRVSVAYIKRVLEVVLALLKQSWNDEDGSRSPASAIPLN